MELLNKQNSKYTSVRQIHLTREFSFVRSENNRLLPFTYEQFDKQRSPLTSHRYLLPITYYLIIALVVHNILQTIFELVCPFHR